MASGPARENRDREPARRALTMALGPREHGFIVRSFVLILTRNNGSELKTVQGVGWGGIISE